MYYVSTRNKEDRRTAAEAIAQGLAADGGLMTPEVFPKLSHNALDTMRDMSYQQRAVYVMNSYLDDFTASELSAYADKAYGGEKFDVKEVAPVRAVDENTYCLELWHGPTCAFKDMALQMLPHLLSASLVKNQEEKTVCILVATSGDTGKAALEGFKDVDKTRILVFYPKDGVSAIQELQMNTQEGDNVGVCSVAGNFDDAQTGVKRLFSDEALREKLAGRGFSSLRPTLSTGAASCRRSSTTSPPTVTFCGRGGFRRGSGSTSASQPATSATFWPPTTPGRWVCPSAGSSAPPTATMY